jgi:hypothetical protein
MIIWNEDLAYVKKKKKKTLCVIRSPKVKRKLWRSRPRLDDNIRKDCGLDLAG